MTLSSGPAGGQAADRQASALVRLAKAYGVEPSYATDAGQEVHVAPDVLVAVLAAFGVDAATPAAIRSALRDRQQARATRLLPPFQALRSGRPADFHAARARLKVPDRAEVWIELADGGTIPLIGRGGRDHSAGLATLPIGQHTLRGALARGRSEAAPLLVVPTRCPPVPDRSWGVLLQLYSVLSARSWGMGDLGDLTHLARWAGGELGAGFIQLNPTHLHAYRPDAVRDASPYSAASRRFRDPIYIRVEDVPEYSCLDDGVADLVAGIAAAARALSDAVLHRDGLIDRDRVWALKRQALEMINRVPLSSSRQEAFNEFRRREGNGLAEFATWSALAEVHGPNWRAWPAELRDPRSPHVDRSRRELASRVDFYCWLAWVVDEQLAEAQAAARAAGMPIGLVHDMAVGLWADGPDAWSGQRYLAFDVNIGCPPDHFNQLGQNWGMPPWRPAVIEDDGYTPFVEMLRSCLRHAGALRVDHVMGLFRLWCTPVGGAPSDGAYVRYDHEALLGILMLEAHRAGAVVIGEDLGTVEPTVREELADRGILGTSVLRLERGRTVEGEPAPRAAPQWRQQCVATLTTHDLPSTAAWLTGDDVRLRDELRLLARPVGEERASTTNQLRQWLKELDNLDLLPAGVCDVPITDDDDIRAVIAALYRFLVLTPSKMVGLWLPDAVGDRRQHNVPGTTLEYPNWRLPVADAHGRPMSLEELTSSARLRELVAIFADLRTGAPGSVELFAGAAAEP
jgi:4-alpha-glucanotransferase